MKNKISKYDFLIIGGGLVGSLAAIALFKKNYKVLVIEKRKQIAKDDRTLAVNANSRNFLKDLNLWANLENEQEHISKIIIKDFINKENLTFQNSQESMGSVIFNKTLLKITRDFLKKNKIFIDGVDSTLLNIRPKSIINVNNKNFYFKKIILSLGKNYTDTEKFKKTEFNSKHKAYVGFLNHQKNHNQIAYEIFTPHGPLAVLPSPSSKKNYSTFIYSTKDQINYKTLSNLIKKNFQPSHGKIKLKKSMSSFSINPHISMPIKKDFIMIGDAAHSIHPVAGQGWNLGIKDIQTLINHLEKYEIDDKNFDKVYFSKRSIENISYLTFTSFLNFLYESKQPLSKLIIQASFSALNKLPILRNLFIKQAMGKINLVG